MPGLIQRAPQGLLALLDAKTSGQNPNSFSDEVSGSIELREFYELQQLASRNVLITAAQLTANIGAVFVPAGNQNTPLQDEIWHLKGVGLIGNSAPAAGTALQLSIGLFDVRSSDFMVFCSSQRFAAAAQNLAVGCSTDIFIKPGFSVGIYVSEAATPTDVLLACTFALYKPV